MVAFRAKRLIWLAIADLLEAIARTAPCNTDDRVLGADGLCRGFEASGAPVLDRDGAVRERVGHDAIRAGRSGWPASRHGFRGATESGRPGQIAQLAVRSDAAGAKVQPFRERGIGKRARSSPHEAL
jgi:hypothetical protein